MIRVAAVLASLCTVLGCATSAPKESALSRDGTRVTVGYRVSVEPGYFIVVERVEDEQWEVKRISQSPLNGRENENQEVLYVSKSRDFVQPFFEKTLTVTKGFNGRTFQCVLIYIDKERYDPCTSSLTRATVAESVGGNLFSAITTLGLASGYHVVIDHDRLVSVVESSDVFAAISHYEYRSAYSTATRSSDLDLFIAKYSDDDPENLIPLAIGKRDNLREMELLAQQRREAQEAARAKAERERRETERVQVQAFRESLAVGVETNCGPVIEARDDILRIYSPVSGYGTEHWLRRDELFPSHYSCGFLNGRYRPPQPNF